MLVVTSKSRREQWLGHVRAWKASGLTCREFASKAGLNPQTLGWYAWRLGADGEQLDVRRKARHRGKLRELMPGMPVVELTPLATTSSVHLEVEVAGATIRVPADFDTTTLTRVLDLLEARR